MSGKLPITLIALILSSCSYVKYEGKPDGSTVASGFELGTTRALTGAKFSTDKNGVRSLSIDSFNADQVEGMRQINQGLSLIIEGAAKGAKP